MRKPKTVVKDIKNWEKKLATLQADLERAKSQEAKASEKKKKVVLLAKTGDEQAGKKLAQAREDELRATLEASEYDEAIEQCQEKLKGLEIEFKESRLEAGKELLTAYGKTVEEEHATVIDRLIGEVITTIQKIQEPGTELRNKLQDLGFPETNFDYEINQAIGAFIRASFYVYAKRYFESRPHNHERKPLAEILNKGRFEFLADKAIRQQTRDEVEGVIRADFSDIRIIPQDEAEAQTALRAKMKQDAETLRKEGVPA